MYYLTIIITSDSSFVSAAIITSHLNSFSFRGKSDATHLIITSGNVSGNVEGGGFSVAAKRTEIPDHDVKTNISYLGEDSDGSDENEEGGYESELGTVSNPLTPQRTLAQELLQAGELYDPEKSKLPPNMSSRFSRR